MKYLIQLGILLLVLSAATIISSILPFPFPASVLGMVLLYMLLEIGWLKLSYIEDTAGFFLNNMAFFFIPAGVGLITTFTALKQHGVAFIIIVIISTLVVMGVTAWVVDQLIRRAQRTGFRLHRKKLKNNSN